MESDPEHARTAATLTQQRGLVPSPYKGRGLGRGYCGWGMKEMLGAGASLVGALRPTSPSGEVAAQRRVRVDLAGGCGVGADPLSHWERARVRVGYSSASASSVVVSTAPFSSIRCSARSPSPGSTFTAATASASTYVSYPLATASTTVFTTQ